MASLRNFLQRDKGTLHPEEERLLRVLDADPRSLQFVALAEFYHKNGQADRSLEISLAGLAFHPTYIRGLVALARAYALAGKSGEAISTLLGVLRQAPENLTAHLELIGLYVQDGQLEVARVHLEAARALGASPAELERRWEQSRLWVQETNDEIEEEAVGDAPIAPGDTGINRRRILLAKIAALRTYGQRFGLPADSPEGLKENS